MLDIGEGRAVYKNLSHLSERCLHSFGIDLLLHRLAFAGRGREYRAGRNLRSSPFLFSNRRTRCLMGRVTFVTLRAFTHAWKPLLLAPLSGQAHRASAQCKQRSDQVVLLRCRLAPLAVNPQAARGADRHAVLKVLLLRSGFKVCRFRVVERMNFGEFFVVFVFVVAKGFHVQGEVCVCLEDAGAEGAGFHLITLWPLSITRNPYRKPSVLY